MESAAGTMSAGLAVSLGTLEARKNQALLLEALSLLRRGGWRMDFYGDGPLHAALTARIEALGLSAQMHWRSWVPRGRIWPAVDLLLQPSLHDGMSNAVAERLHRCLDVPQCLTGLRERQAESARRLRFDWNAALAGLVAGEGPLPESLKQ